MTFRWRADDGPTLNAGLVAAIFRGSGSVLLENPIFCDFSGGSGPPALPLDPHMFITGMLQVYRIFFLGGEECSTLTYSA